MVIIDGYPMDLAISEAPVFNSEVTDHPTEEGADLSDHIHNLPEELTLECLVSNDPIDEIAADPTRQRTDANAPLPADDAYNRLILIRDRRKPVAITCSFGLFSSMGMTQLSPKRDYKTCEGLLFSVTFKRMNAAEVRRVTVIAEPIASGSQNLGALAMKTDEKGRVVRRIDLNTSNWFDPVIGGWRARAERAGDGTWKFYKGTPTAVEPGDVHRYGGERDDKTYKQIIDSKRGSDVGYLTGVGARNRLQETPSGWNAKGERIGGSGPPIGKTITYGNGVIVGAT